MVWPGPSLHGAVGHALIAVESVVHGIGYLLLLRSIVLKRTLLALPIITLSIYASSSAPVLAQSGTDFRIPPLEAMTASNVSRIVPLLVLDHNPSVPYPVSSPHYGTSTIFSPDHTFIADQTPDGALWLIDLQHGVERAILRGQLLPVLGWHSLIQPERNDSSVTLRLWNMSQLLPTVNSSPGDVCRVQVTAPVSNLFAEASVDSSLLRSLATGDTFQVLATDLVRHWIQVRSDFGPAWLAPQAREFTGNCDNLPFWLLPGTEQSAFTYADNQRTVLNGDGSLTVITLPALTPTLPTPSALPTLSSATQTAQPPVSNFNGKPIHIVNIPSPIFGDSPPNYVVDVNHSVWSLDSGQLLFTIRVPQAPTPTPDFIPEIGGLNLWAFSPDQTLLAWDYGDGTVHIWDIARRQDVQTVDGARAPLFSPNGHYLVTRDRVFDKLHGWQWNDRTRQFESMFASDGNALSGAFSADSKFLLTTAIDSANWIIHIQDLSANQLRATFSIPATASSNLRFNADNSLLFPDGLADRSTDLPIRDVSTGQPLTVTKDASRLVGDSDSTLLANAQILNLSERFTLWGVPVNVLPTMTPTPRPPGTPTSIPEH